MSNKKVWTPERDAVILRDWPAGEERDDIEARIRALPGPQMKSADQIRTRAGYLRVKRTAWYMSMVKARGAQASLAQAAAAKAKRERDEQRQREADVRARVEAVKRALQPAKPEPVRYQAAGFSMLGGSAVTPAMAARARRW